MERALERLSLLVPVVLAVIVLMLYLNFRRVSDVVIVMAGLPFALIGAVWLLWALSYDLSVAVWVGFIALAGVAAETVVIMLVYLNNAWRDSAQRNAAALHEAVMEGAVRRLRPKMMTVLTIIAGLLPIMLGTGTGSEVMRRIAAPMVGGMLTALLLTLVLVPVAYYLWHERLLKKEAA